MKLSRILYLIGAAPLLACLLAAPAAAYQEGGEGKGSTKTWLQLFETTGPVGYLMAGCSVAGTTLV
ncbi:MAG: hypothetical protein EXS08_16205, partial [Planctomycetes bacterium]|nr:hypothetical protein [Planctomycetota bacterium]MSR63967.1 hypothetical protein [Planctomycetota bacterium]